MIVSRKALYAKYDGRCAYCGVKLAKYGWQRDHVLPLVRYRGRRYTFSGRHGCVHPERHVASNIVAACKACNKAKGVLELEVWRKTLGKKVVFWMERYDAAS